MCVHVIFKATEHANYYVHADLKDIFQFPNRIQNILVFYSRVILIKQSIDFKKNEYTNII